MEETQALDSTNSIEEIKLRKEKIAEIDASILEQKAKIELLFSDGKVADADIEKKAKELQNLINKMEAKEERWFELSAKMEG